MFAAALGSDLSAMVEKRYPKNKEIRSRTLVIF